MPDVSPDDASGDAALAMKIIDSQVNVSHTKESDADRPNHTENIDSGNWIHAA
jgi:hypothetical protein